MSYFVTNLIKERRNDFINGNRKSDVLDKILDGVKDEPWTDEVIRQLRDEIKTFSA